MYNINRIQENGLQYVILKHPQNNAFAKISLTEGGSLNEFRINNEAIIEDLTPLNYANTYASSILFPFANRIKDGTYTFNGETHQFAINLKEENNALHGLVYNKTFKVINEDASNDGASVVLEFMETSHSKGFPFTYGIQLKYTLNDTKLKLGVTIKNTDTKAFPFTLGWHPYFISRDLFNSAIEFNCTKKIVLDERLISTGTEDVNYQGTFKIKDQKLDDCFVLNSNTIQFVTPTYNLVITASAKANFLQLYTPSRANTIAIEPTTGVSDSFNNTIGLQTLNPGETYSINWALNVQLTP